ncbi:MAG: histidinol-phosphate transaminase [Nitrospinales bacterium]
MAKVNLTNLVRDRVKSLKAYQVENFDCKIKLHANESPFSPEKKISTLIKECADDIQINRYPDPDCHNLKKTISGLLAVPENNLIVGNGSDELIQFILQTFCEPGDTITFPDPTFAMYKIIAQGMGIRSSGYPLDENWDFEANEFLEFLEERDSKVVFFSYPNNPTGNCFSAKAIKSIIEKFRGIVVVDEAYYDFSAKTFINEMPNNNNLIVLKSLSKIGMAGLRIGYGIAEPELIEQFNKVRLPYNSNSISQLLSEKLLSNFAVIQKQIDIIKAEREKILTGLSDIEGITPYPSDSNFILFRSKMDSTELFNKLAKNGILIRNLGGHPRLSNCLRVTVGTKEENDQFLEQVRNLTN